MVGGINMRIDKFVEQLKRGAGADRAIKIAERCMKATAQSERGLLPHGPIFTEKDRKGKLPMGEKHLNYIHNFWTNCYYVLKKQEGKKK